MKAGLKSGSRKTGTRNHEMMFRFNIRIAKSANTLVSSNIGTSTKFNLKGMETTTERS